MKFQVRKVGNLTTAICRQLVDGMVTVSDQEICRAILLLLEGEKTVAEGAGAAGVAALLSGKIDVRGKRVATVLCGGNIDMNAIAIVIEHGLRESWRRVSFTMDLPDKPGALSNLMSRIGQYKANVYVPAVLPTCPLIDFSCV